MKRNLFVVAGIGMLMASVAPQSGAFAQTQTEMNMQAASDYKKADAELNTVYKKLIARLDKEGQAKLKKAQRNWILYRNTEMEFAADGARGGSMSPMLRSGAGTRITKSRIKDLNTYISDYSSR